MLTALAADQGAAAVGVVLSCSGSDGSLGLKPIKVAGNDRRRSAAPR